MNFIESIQKGKEGLNFGLPMGNHKISSTIDGVQKKTVYAIGAAPKVKRN